MNPPVNTTYHDPFRPGSASRAAARLYLAALLLTLSWGLLAFGAVYPWAYTPLALAAIVVGGLGFVLGRSRPWTEKPLALALALVASSQPATRATATALLSRISPNTLRFLESVDLTWVLGPRGAHPVSIAPAKTWLGLSLFVAFAVLLLGSARAFGRFGVLAFVRALIAIGVGVALFAIVQAALNAGKLAYEVKIYGFWQPIYRATPFGPFVNRNHFAGWMLLVLPIAVAYLCGMIERGLRHVPATWRHRTLWMGSPEGGRSVLMALAVSVMGLSLLASQSRSGLSSLTRARARGRMAGDHAWRPSAACPATPGPCDRRDHSPGVGWRRRRARPILNRGVRARHSPRRLARRGPHHQSVSTYGYGAQYLRLRNAALPDNKPVDALPGSAQ